VNIKAFREKTAHGKEAESLGEAAARLLDKLNRKKNEIDSKERRKPSTNDSTPHSGRHTTRRFPGLEQSGMRVT